MQNIEYISDLDNRKNEAFSKKHHQIIEQLERMLEKGVPDLTMSQIASRLKISLRTLYEIAPSKDQLITMIMDVILKKLGKHAIDSISDVKSPIKKLEKYDNYNQLDKFLNIIQEIELSNNSTLLSAYNLADFLLAEIKNQDVKKRFKIDLTNADFSNFNQKQLKILGATKY